MTNLEKMFWDRVGVQPGGNDCWIWLGTRDKDGYGKIGSKGTRAHRLSWEMAYAPIPNGMLIRHRCDNPSCVRPSHLQIGTDADNMKDRDIRGRGVRGSRCHTSALVEWQVRMIRELHKLGHHSYRDLAAVFGIAYQNVGLIVTRKVWKHI